ncbi:MAG: transcription termination factor Rho [Phycisphaeraceae bacterium]|nr:transcription termination factor Rho [Phycisphaeraceae bacterium]
MQQKTGILELWDGSNGRLRLLDQTLVANARDPVIPTRLVERMSLRPGLELEVSLGAKVGGGNGQQHSKRGKKGKKKKKKSKGKQKFNPVDPAAQLVEQVHRINGLEPDEYAQGPKFEDLTTVDPEPRLTLEYPGCPAACRLIDLFCPIGFGTRGMIVSPPKAGKTTLLQNIAFSISKNHPHVEVFALLIDERPEEVTDFRRNVPCHVLASSNDHDVERHVGLAVLAVERAKRLAESGRDVAILLDSLTRVGRAFNTMPGLANSGRTLTGGVDAGALAIPKQLFGAARRFEEGGSLTILATALIDTGSRGDQLIFEEFKGTGNMELILDRKVAEKRIFPAIDLAASGTRKEQLLMGEHELQTMSALRRRLFNMQPDQQVEQLLKALDRFKTNDELVGSPQSPARA